MGVRFLNEMLLDKRVILSIVVLLFISLVFWASSRYPSLNDKAAMSGSFTLEDPMGFTASWGLSDDDPVVTRIAKTTYNWMQTNKKGMIFGLLFAAGFLTLFGLIREFRMRNPLQLTLFGAVLGAPLGVCVNCAAPIARGMAAAGLPAQSTLAAMISSPTLNVVILTMLFSLFPFHMAVAKVVGTIVFIFVFIPLLTKLFRSQPRPSLPDASSATGLGRFFARLPFDEDDSIGSAARADNWIWAAGWVIRNYVKGLWFVLYMTVPLMLLAGVLGAVVVTLVPWDSIGELAVGSSRLDTLMRLIAVAVIGIFLPVPIGFDVVLSAALLGAGWSEHVVMILLFTLGISSVYSFMIVWQAFTLRLAAAIMLTLTGIGLISGYGIHAYNKFWYDQARLAPIFTLKETPPPAQTDLRIQASIKQAELLPENAPSRYWEQVETADRTRVSIRRSPFLPSVEPVQGAPVFRRFDAKDFGIRAAFSPSLLFTLTEFAFEQSLAAGDVHRDGWQDLAFTYGGRLTLYANLGNGKFGVQPVNLGLLGDERIAFTKIVDLNGDGWDDLFLIVREKGVFVSYNHQGRFDQPLSRLPTPDHFVSGTATFADLDRDGDLDILLAPRWSGQSAVSRAELPASTKAAILWRRQSGFVLGEPFGLSGAKLTALVTDLNGDHYPDILMANDYYEPDEAHLNRGSEGGYGFSPLNAENPYLKRTTFYTMAIAKGDIDNDLNPDYYYSNISQGSHEDRDRLSRVSPAQACETLVDTRSRRSCIKYSHAFAASNLARKRRDFRACNALADQALRRDCLEVSVARYAWTQRKPHKGVTSNCDLLSDHYPLVRGLCERMTANDMPDHSITYPFNPQQNQSYNMLLSRNAAGYYQDRAEGLNLHVGGWTWNSEFADLDNDGWQDLFLANGWVMHDEWESNILFRNDSGSLSDQTVDFGLADHLPTLNHVSVDYDNDGDLDLVMHGLFGVVRLYENNTSNRNAVQFRLVFDTGNRNALGAKVIIHHGDQKRKNQVQEIADGGGFNSQSSNILHFGLGQDKEIRRVEVIWPNGVKTVIDHPLQSGYLYELAF